MPGRLAEQHTCRQPLVQLLMGKAGWDFFSVLCQAGTSQIKPQLWHTHRQDFSLVHRLNTGHFSKSVLLLGGSGQSSLHVVMGGQQVQINFQWTVSDRDRVFPADRISTSKPSQTKSGTPWVLKKSCNSRSEVSLFLRGEALNCVRYKKQWQRTGKTSLWTKWGIAPHGFIEIWLTDVLIINDWSKALYGGKSHQTYPFTVIVSYSMKISRSKNISRPL